MSSRNGNLIRTSADAQKLHNVVAHLFNKELRNHMKVPSARMQSFNQFVCSDGVTPLNSLLGVINAFIFVFMEESPLANYNREDECKRMVIEYFTSPHKLNLISKPSLLDFTSTETRFWVTLSMHYSEKWSAMIEAIVVEGINPSQRINGLIFTRQIGNFYMEGDPSQRLLESYRNQFLNVSDDNTNFYQNYFEQSTMVPEMNSPEANNLVLCFSNHFNKFTTQQIMSVSSLLSTRNYSGLRSLCKHANNTDGNKFYF